MGIDTSQIGFDDSENTAVADAPAPQEKGPVRKPTIALFLNPDLTVSWTVDEEKVKGVDAVLHCLNSMKAALECDRDTVRAIEMQQRMMQAVQQQNQVQTFARGPSYKPRRTN